MTAHERRVSAVTGASRGIGRATALKLARRGDRVFALARTEEDLGTLVREARDLAGHIVPITVDVADDGARDAAIAAILDATGGYGLDVLVNNAGFGQYGPLEEVSIQQFRRQIEVNLTAVLALTQAFLPGMRDRQNGWVINVSSAAGRIATPFMGAYNASKFALEGMSDALRMELAPFNVHIVLVEPGPIRTHFGEEVSAHWRQNPSSPYARFLHGWDTSQATSRRFAGAAEDVADIIVRATQLNHPLPRYTVTTQAKLASIGRRLAPDIVVDWVLRRAMGLKRL